jgi:predicted metal-dependent hydrolase
MMFNAGGRAVPLQIIKRAGVRRMNLRVDTRQVAVRLTLPRFAPLGPAMRWVEEKRGWIEAQLDRIPDVEAIAPGMCIPLGDEELTLDWSPAYRRAPERTPGVLRIGGPVETLGPRLLRWLKQEALIRLKEETMLAAARASVVVTAAQVGDPRSRWGSCSYSGVIRYSWRLILAPDFVLKATVAHEVAHRIHMDHSPAFHAKVAEIYGADPKAARLWLRANGVKLHSFGRSY